MKRIQVKREALIVRRILAGFSQRRLALEAGIAHSYISLLENGKKETVGPGVAKKIAQALEAEPGEIFLIVLK